MLFNNYLRSSLLLLMALYMPSVGVAQEDEPLAQEPAAEQLTADEINAAIDNTLGDSSAYQKLFYDLQEANRTNNREQLADLISYPFEVEIDGKQHTITSSAMFLKSYDKIMIPEVIQTIENAKYEDVMVNYQGVMLGEGQVWLSGICTDENCTDVEVKVLTLQAGPE